MKQFILKFSLSIGLLIYAVFRIIDHFVTISDSIAIPVMIISIIFMLIGVVYNGWCLGKEKNPFKS